MSHTRPAGSSSAMHRDKATALFVNYFKALAEKLDMNWHPDFSVEIAEAVDHITDAAVDQFTEEEHRRNGGLLMELKSNFELLEGRVADLVKDTMAKLPRPQTEHEKAVDDLRSRG